MDERRKRLWEQQLRHDMALAQSIQKNMLPRIPISSQWDIGYIYKPADAISGDFVDIYNFTDIIFDDDENEEEIGILLLDAIGHGISAALITVLSKPIFFRAHREYKDYPLTEAMFNANVELVNELKGTGVYSTGVSVRLKNNTVKIVNCSHPCALYSSSKRPDKIYSIPNSFMMLGLETHVNTLTEKKIQVDSGDILLLYTDGLTEAKNSSGAYFGEKNVAKAIKESRKKQEEPHSEGVLTELLLALKKFGCNIERLDDDMTVVVIIKK